MPQNSNSPLSLLNFFFFFFRFSRIVFYCFTVMIPRFGTDMSTKSTKVVDTKPSPPQRKEPNKNIMLNLAYKLYLLERTFCILFFLETPAPALPATAPAAPATEQPQQPQQSQQEQHDLALLVRTML